MTSILTNMAAISALRSLGATQAVLGRTQTALQTGLSVSSPADNAVDWSIATLMRSDVAALGTIQDSLALTSAIADVTSAALDTIIGATEAIRQDLIEGEEAGVDRSALEDDVVAQQKAIIQTARDASFNGVDWLVQSKTADIDIQENHQLDDSFAAIDAGEVAPQHTQALGTAPTVAPPKDETTAYLAADSPPYGSSEPFAPQYTFQDDVTYTASAHEVDQNGNRASETVSYSGIDQDVASTYAVWENAPDATLWQGYDEPLIQQDSWTPATSSNETVTGDVDFKAAEEDDVPDGIAAGQAASMAIDTNQFLLFTDYTGTTTVTEETTDSTGAIMPGSIVFGNRSFSRTQSYASYDDDNGFDVDPGALDTDVADPNASNDLTSDPEADLASLNSKTTILNFDLATDDGSQILNSVETDLTSLRAMSTKLGTLQNCLQDQKTFDTLLANALTSGVGALVDADMETTATHLAALQTQQQLGLQSLALANRQTSLVLRLFESS